jgi:hypothetical protein
MSQTVTINPNPSYTKVLILNPRVGLTVMISSPLSRFKMVVFPALSSPLNGYRVSGYQQLSSVSESEYAYLQKEDAHFSLLPSVLANYCKQTHTVDVLNERNLPKLRRSNPNRISGSKLGSWQQVSKVSKMIGDGCRMGDCMYCDNVKQ